MLLHHVTEGVSSGPLQGLRQCAEDEAAGDEGERRQAEGPAAPLRGGAGQERQRPSGHVR